jgi:hypothetical protein
MEAIFTGCLGYGFSGVYEFQSILSFMSIIMKSSGRAQLCLSKEIQNIGMLKAHHIGLGLS